uniref:Peptidase S1 domain-containing protein n=1 Tax=Stomoxys calcitrans TaxID=35570 RepID=A0A1I8P4W9_STOCA
MLKSITFLGLTVLCLLVANTHAGAVVAPIKCGKRNVGGVAVGASVERPLHVAESEFGEFPWTVDINKEGTVFCVGSLIHPKVVLTAGQCVLRGDANSLKIRAGLWDRVVKNEHLPYQERSVEKTITHPAMHERSKDIALIIVNEPFTLGPHINTICLPPLNHVTADGILCYATGWGNTALLSSTSQRMKRIILNTVDRTTCQNNLQLHLDRSVLCAVGRNGTDTCSGDSGAALVTRIASNPTAEVYHQIGITSFGASCFAGLPGGYTDVAYLREWIDYQMEANGLEKSSYEAV